LGRQFNHESDLGDNGGPGILDDLMARRAWNGQMTNEPAPPRPDNLFVPVAGKAHIHGPFAPVSRSRAITASASLVRGLAGLVVLGAVAAAVGLMRRRPADANGIIDRQFPAE
jgi:hypothetical protein